MGIQNTKQKKLKSKISKNPHNEFDDKNNISLTRNLDLTLNNSQFESSIEKDKHADIKTKNSTNYQTEISLTSSSTDNENENKNCEKEVKELSVETVPFVFEWDKGGKDVKMSGNFLKNWGLFIKLIKNPNTGVFEYRTNLPRRSYQFKFMVDGKWTCSDKYKKIKERITYNNYIDLTVKDKSSATSDIIYLGKNNETENIKNKSISNCINKAQNLNYDNSIKNIETETNESSINENNEVEYRKLEEISKEYNNFYPLKSEMKIIGINCFNLYRHSFNLENNICQELNMNSKFLSCPEYDLLSENNSYKKTYGCPDYVINHILLDESIEKERHLRLGLTTRRNKKKISVVYYTPNKAVSQSKEIKTENKN